MCVWVGCKCICESLRLGWWVCVSNMWTSQSVTRTHTHTHCVVHIQVQVVSQKERSQAPAWPNTLTLDISVPSRYLLTRLNCLGNALPLRPRSPPPTYLPRPVLIIFCSASPRWLAGTRNVLLRQFNEVQGNKSRTRLSDVPVYLRIS